VWKIAKAALDEAEKAMVVVKKTEEETAPKSAS